MLAIDRRGEEAVLLCTFRQLLVVALVLVLLASLAVPAVAFASDTGFGGGGGNLASTPNGLNCAGGVGTGGIDATGTGSGGVMASRLIPLPTPLSRKPKRVGRPLYNERRHSWRLPSRWEAAVTTS